jgi:hypothetical protein
MKEWEHLVDSDGRPDAADIVRFLGARWDYTRDLSGTDFYRSVEGSANSLHLKFLPTDPKGGIDFCFFVTRVNQKTGEKTVPSRTMLNNVTSIDLVESNPLRQIVITTTGAQFRLQAQGLNGQLLSADESMRQEMNFNAELRQY